MHGQGRRQARAEERRRRHPRLGRLQRDGVPRARGGRHPRGDRGAHGLSLVVKPASQGSSLGVKFASARGEVPGALIAAFSYDDRVLLERYVEGRELAVGVLGSDPLPVVEAIPRDSEKFDFEARYEIGRTDYVCPADLSEAEASEVTDLAARAYETLGCSGFARVDLMLGADGPQVLEVNAIPGLTDTSLFPMAAEAAGIDFEQLVERLVELAHPGATRP